MSSRMITSSLALTKAEIELVRSAAISDGLSMSKRIAVIANRMARPEHDALVQAWCDTMGRRRFEHRDHRASSLINSNDMIIIREAAKRAKVPAHTWLRAVAVMSIEDKIEANPGIHAPSPEKRVPDIAPSYSSPYENAARLLAKTLAALLINPDRIADVTLQMRKLAGVPEATGLRSEHLLNAALRATTDRKTGNVVPLRQTVENKQQASKHAPPRYVVGTVYVTDQWTNRANISIFGSVEKAQAALETLIDCVGCTDCVACSNCRNCHQCGQCTNCAGCQGCLGVANQVGAIGVRP